MASRDLLFELGTEELPPRTLKTLSVALLEGMLKGIDAAGIPHGKSRAFATPRRLAVLIGRCAEYAPDRRIERRGPPVAASFDAGGAPTPAAAAFAKSCGVAVDALERLTTDKGAWLAFRGTEPGAATTSLLEGIVSQAVAGLPIAKRMRWGSRAAEFVRPVRSVVLLFGEAVVPAEILGIRSDRFTFGHRFHSPGKIALRSPGAYEGRLRRAKVIADFDARRGLILQGVRAAAAAVGGEALIEEALLDEVTALVEWPVPVAGRFEARFLSLPREVVIATVQDHQRYFPVAGPDGRLSGDFVTVSNIESRNPAIVREGNERVVRPRLSDAAFFWDQDCKLSLSTLAARLRDVTFQTRLGSYADKTTRVRALALKVAERISAPETVGRAAELAKADLMSAMVGEFPELQGTMGRYYALAQGESAEVALAIEDHYKPRYAGDSLPSGPLGRTLALADKIDTLVGIFAIEQRPTGTKDPFGLRRAALGVLRILLEGRLDLNLVEALEAAAVLQPVQRTGVAAEVYDFIVDRLRGLLLERPGTSPEMLDAVLVSRPPSPLDAERRLQALQGFLALPEAAVLAALNKRIGNILRKAPPGAPLTVDSAAFREDAERELHRVLTALEGPVRRAIADGRYPDALTALTGLRSAVDEFFERILVMDENPAVRNNRLALLGAVQSLLGGVADLSRLPGLIAPMQVLRSLLFTTYMMVSACLFGAFMSLCFWAPHRFQFAVARMWARCLLWVLERLCGLKFSVEGVEHIPAGNHIVMSNHTSAWETIAQFVIFPPHVWVLKRELLWIPFVGWGLKLLRPIAINRGEGHRAVNQVVEQGKARLADGLWIIVFPEGTRVLAGQRKKFGVSGALLATATGKLVVPLSHNAGQFWPRRGFLKKAGTIHVVIGAPISPLGKNPRELNEEVRQSIDAGLRKIAAT